MTACVFIGVGTLGRVALAGAPPPLIGPLVAPELLVVPLPEFTPEERERVFATAGAGLIVDWFDVATRVLWGSTVEPGAQVPPYDPPTEEERRLVEIAVYHCDNAGARFAKPYVMLELLRTEAEFDVPAELRGVTLAAWCGEAAYQIDKVIGDGGAAVGILQLHPELTQFCGAPDLRHDPIASAQCWLWNLRRVYQKSKRMCRPQDAWKAAELWLSQGGRKSNYACRKVSGHVARLEQWQRLSAQEERVASNATKR